MEFSARFRVLVSPLLFATTAVLQLHPWPLHASPLRCTYLHRTLHLPARCPVVIAICRAIAFCSTSRRSPPLRRRPHPHRSRRHQVAHALHYFALHYCRLSRSPARRCCRHYTFLCRLHHCVLHHHCRCPSPTLMLLTEDSQYFKSRGDDALCMHIVTECDLGLVLDKFSIFYDLFYFIFPLLLSMFLFYIHFYMLFSLLVIGSPFYLISPYSATVLPVLFTLCSP